jgi:hypothetical protein
MTPERYLKSFRAGSYVRTINSLSDFLEAVASGEDIWSSGNRSFICYSTENGASEYDALKALGWSAGTDYGYYGMEDMFVYSPHPKV